MFEEVRFYFILLHFSNLFDQMNKASYEKHMDIFKRRSLLNHEEDRFQKKIINQTIVKIQNDLMNKKNEANLEKNSLTESKSPPLDDSTKKKLVKNWLEHAKLNQKQKNIENKSDSNSNFTSNQTEKSEELRLPKLKSNDKVKFNSKINKNNSNLDSNKMSKNVLQNENNDLGNHQTIITELSELKKSNQKNIEDAKLNKQYKPIRGNLESKPLFSTRKVSNNSNHNSRKAAYFKPVESVRVQVKFDRSLNIHQEEGTSTEPVHFYIDEKEPHQFEKSQQNEIKNE